MGELRERLIFLFENPPSDDSGEKADEVLAEITKDHVIVRKDWRQSKEGGAECPVCGEWW
jgi:hypothetical protein